jgi:hypothetical protein
MPGTGRELFNRSHYNVLAKRIREAREMYKVIDTPADSTGAANIVVQNALDMVVHDLADWFAEDNPRFERDTWMEATNTNV